MAITTDLYYNAAMGLGLPCKPYCPKAHTVHISLGKKTFLFYAGYSPFNDAAAAEYASQKYLANRALARAGLPVPKIMCVAKHDYRQHNVALHNLSFPVVIKPNRNIFGGGRGVICNIQNTEILIQALNELFKITDKVVIEEFHQGYKQYRVLVFYGKVIGVVERLPAHIVGDGASTVEALIGRANIFRKKQAKMVSMGSIVIDREVHIRLNELGLKLSLKPAKGEVVRLCYGCNSTRGGTMKSLGRAICKANERLMCSAAAELNLYIVGFDVLCRDIMVPIWQSGGVIIEANANPDLSIHECPLLGPPVAVSKTIVRKIVKQHLVLYRLHRTHEKTRSCQRSVNFKKVFVILFLAYTLSHVHFFSDVKTKPHISEIREYNHATNIV